MALLNIYGSTYGYDIPNSIRDNIAVIYLHRERKALNLKLILRHTLLAIKQIF